MSKEAGAAILTHLYFTRVPLSATMTQTRLGPNNVHVDMIKRIGQVYAAFLCQHTLFEAWAKEFGEKVKRRVCLSAPRAPRTGCNLGIADA